MKLLLLLSMLSGLFVLLNANQEAFNTTTTPEPDPMLMGLQDQIAHINCTGRKDSSCQELLDDLHRVANCMINIENVMLEVCPNGCNGKAMPLKSLRTPVCVFKVDFKQRKSLCCP